MIGYTKWGFKLANIVWSSYWLARTAIRVGLGPTTRKLLVDFAVNKPEYVRLVQVRENIRVINIINLWHYQNIDGVIRIKVTSQYYDNIEYKMIS